MVKDLIIGGATNYGWDQLKYWVNSIRKSGFTGDVALVGTNYKKETIERLTKEGIFLSLYGTTNEQGDIVDPSPNAPHVARFFYIWNYLNSTKEQYRYIITTDTKDVVFQKNPSTWLEEKLVFHSLVASSEGMRYKNEPWNDRNLLECFGPYFHNKLKDQYINNVGVIAGESAYVRGLLLFLFQLSINRPIPIVDQAIYNFISNTEPFVSDTLFTTNQDGWAIQLGTTEKAVEAGSGDLGIVCANDPTKLALYKMHFEDIQPSILEDGVYFAKGEKYVIAHQWDRVPELRKTIEDLYGDN